MVAIVLTGLVVLLAYGAAQVRYDAHTRLTAGLRALQTAQALRELLQDALRSARGPQRPGDSPFTLHAGRLSFVTAGGGPPLDPDYDWLLTIEAGADGLELSARPVGRVPAAVVTMRGSGVTRWDVGARAPGEGASQWLGEWPEQSGVPRGVGV